MEVSPGEERRDHQEATHDDAEIGARSGEADLREELCRNIVRREDEAHADLELASHNDRGMREPLEELHRALLPSQDGEGTVATP